jgi:hypothetical protein
MGSEFIVCYVGNEICQKRRPDESRRREFCLIRADRVSQHRAHLGFFIGRKPPTLCKRDVENLDR